MASKDILGRRGEELATRYLRRAGYTVIDRNWRCRAGEIDVIAERADETVFVEVKTRSSVAYGHPFEAITLSKMARLRRLAAAWCEQASVAPRSIRIDAIAIIAPAGVADDAVRIEHLEGLC